MKIFKYEIGFNEDPIVMPKNARIVHVGKQGFATCIWAIVDPSQENELRTIQVFGTGHEIPTGLNYIATWQDAPFQTDARCNVWHLFEGAPK